MEGSPVPLRIAGLRKSFRRVVVLDGLDLDVAAGSLLVLLGASGAGKSTLLRIVAGLDQADAGTIEIGSQVVANPKSVVPAEHRGVGMVFQALELWPHMTVAENIAFGLDGRPRGSSAAAHPRVLDVADSVGLPRNLLGRRPATLSGGERQRVAIARALAPDPRVLLYDEPLANLDPERRGEIRRLVREIRRSGRTTVIYVTHDAGEALEMGDQIAVLGGGRVVDHGRPEDLYKSPSCLASARALGVANVLPLRVAAGADGRPSLETLLGAFSAAAGTISDQRSALFRPEQVVPSEEGAAALVLDAYPRGPDWAFSAKLADGGHLVEGRSSSRLDPGSQVRLKATTAPSSIDAREGPPSKGASS